MVEIVALILVSLLKSLFNMRKPIPGSVDLLRTMCGQHTALRDEPATMILCNGYSVILPSRSVSIFIQLSNLMKEVSLCIEWQLI